MAIIFHLQRGVSWSQQHPTELELRVFRSLLLRLAALDVPAEYRAQESGWWERWEHEFKPNMVVHRQAVAETLMSQRPAEAPAR